MILINVDFVTLIKPTVPSTTDDTPCINGDARLVNGSAEYEGRVEMCYDNQWGTICADQWNNVAASVVCAQLGFMEEGEQYKSQLFLWMIGLVFTFCSKLNIIH